MSSEPPHLRTIVAAATVAICAGLAAILVLTGGASASPVEHGLEVAAAAVIAVIAIGATVAFVLTRLAGWRDPASEEEFELLVRRSESLARDGLWAEPDEGDFLELDPLRDEDFDELVRDALDELPDLLRNALRHVAVVISDKGARHRAYGLYQGDGSRRGDAHDRIVIFRDTLRRDFGHDPDLLREQVTRTVRHELAHHVGFDEMGVRGLGL
jgi:predicted Zn-dependent protease with MMP-like domain